jgi:hypothetical protein
MLRSRAFFIRWACGFAVETNEEGSHNQEKSNYNQSGLRGLSHEFIPSAAANRRRYGGKSNGSGNYKKKACNDMRHYSLITLRDL